MTTLRVTEDTTRADLAEAIANLNRTAKRQMYVVEKFTTDPPSKWSQMHARLNDLLTEHETAS